MKLALVAIAAATATASFVAAAVSDPAVLPHHLRASSPAQTARELLSPPLLPSQCFREDAYDFVGNDLSSLPGQVSSCCDHCQATYNCRAWSWTNYNGGTCWLKRGRGTVVVNPDVISGVQMGGNELYPCGDLEYSTDYIGYDIGSTRMLKPADCCAECARMPGCKAFTHTKYDGGTCWLKSQKGRMVYNPEATSSIAYGASAVVPNCGLEANVDFVGNDIGSAAASQPTECCAKCQAFSGCRAFSWTTQSGGTCWFKNRKDMTIAAPGVTSAAVFPNPRSPSCALERGTDYVGNDIGNHPGVADAYGCCSICMNTAGCKAFSWTQTSRGGSGTCWLKSGKGATVANANVMSSVV